MEPRMETIVPKTIGKIIFTERTVFDFQFVRDINFSCCFIFIFNSLSDTENSNNKWNNDRVPMPYMNRQQLQSDPAR